MIYFLLINLIITLPIIRKDNYAISNGYSSSNPNYTLATSNAFTQLSGQNVITKSNTDSNSYIQKYYTPDPSLFSITNSQSSSNSNSISKSQDSIASATNNSKATSTVMNYGANNSFSSNTALNNGSSYLLTPQGNSFSNSNTFSNTATGTVAGHTLTVNFSNGLANSQISGNPNGDTSSNSGSYTS